MSAANARTVVELIDTNTETPGHVARGVRVNGSPVRVAENGISIEYGDNAPTKVTLELIVDEVNFRSESRYATGGFASGSITP